MRRWRSLSRWIETQADYFGAVDEDLSGAAGAVQQGVELRDYADAGACAGAGSGGG